MAPQNLNASVRSRWTESLYMAPHPVPQKTQWLAISPHWDVTHLFSSGITAQKQHFRLPSNEPPECVFLSSVVSEHGHYWPRRSC